VSATAASQADAVVVGAGVMGAAAARALGRRGARVILLERFDVGHDRGSSHGASRIFRFSYPDRRYVHMAMEALPLWRELEAESGQELITTLGGLDVGKALDQHVDALSACGARFELLDGSEASRRFPGLVLPPGTQALFQPDAGITRADRAVRELVRSAIAHGVEVRAGTRVTALIPEAGGVEVRTSSGAGIRGAVAVVTAGAWAPGLLAGIGYHLDAEPSRETVAYFRVDDELSYPTLVDWGDPSVYALPGPGQGLKTGEHHAGPAVDPDQQGGPSQESVARLRDWVRLRYPRADPEPHLLQTCLYTNTPDEHFVLDRAGDVVVGSPCSGHGFKFAPLIGERLADLALGSA
jgi:sarcosine oxidase